MEIDSELIFRLILLGFLFLFSIFFAGSEVALFSLNSLDVDRIKSKRKRIGSAIENLLKNPQELIITIYFGNEISNVAISAVITVVALHFFGSKGLVLAVGIGVMALIVFGEIIPKSVAHINPMRWSSMVALPLLYFMRFISPVRYLLNKVTFKIVRLLGGSGRIEKFMTEEDLLSIVEESADEGIIYQEEKDMINSLFKLDDMKIYEIMTLRQDILAIDIESDFEDAIDKMRRSKFARAPLYRDSIDNIVGIIFKKDLLKLNAESSLESLARKPLILPETMSLNDLIIKFKRTKTHMAIAMDEYGGVAGIITLDDVLSEIVVSDKKGMIHSYNKEGEYILDASMSLDDLRETLKVDISSDDVDTVGGYIFHVLEREPKRYDKVKLDKARFEVLDVSGVRITKVALKLLDKQQNG